MVFACLLLQYLILFCQKIHKRFYENIIMCGIRLLVVCVLSISCNSLAMLRSVGKLTSLTRHPQLSVVTKRFFSSQNSSENKKKLASQTYKKSAEKMLISATLADELRSLNVQALEFAKKVEDFELNVIPNISKNERIKEDVAELCKRSQFLTADQQKKLAEQNDYTTKKLQELYLVQWRCMFAAMRYLQSTRGGVSARMINSYKQDWLNCLQEMTKLETNFYKKSMNN